MRIKSRLYYLTGQVSSKVSVLILFFLLTALQSGSKMEEAGVCGNAPLYRSHRNTPSEKNTSAAASAKYVPGRLSYTTQKKHCSDSLKNEITAMLRSGFGDDTNVRLYDFPENIAPLPRYTGSIWDATVVIGFVKTASGCKMVTLTRKKDGFSGYIQMRHDTLHDTIHVSGCYFHLTDKIYFDAETGAVTTLRGDTVRSWGSDLNEPIWYLRSLTDDYMEFSGFSGTQVTLKAHGVFTDTVLYRCVKRDPLICLKRRGISIVPYSGGTLSAIGGQVNRSIVVDKCIAQCDSSGRIEAAISKINAFLKGKRYVVSSDDRGVRIYRNRALCLHDHRSSAFPVGNSEK
jgi:hypothetical protein